MPFQPIPRTPGSLLQSLAGAQPMGQPQDLKQQLGLALMQQVGSKTPDFTQVLGLAKQRMESLKPPPVRHTLPLGQTGATLEVDHSEPVSPNATGIVKLAEKYLGTKYVWGGASPKGFDCSGFVQWLYGQQGVKLSRTTYTQIKQGRPVDMAHLQPGDVVFFSHNGDVHHEGMYIGHGQFIHAPHTGDVVKISSLSDPYYHSQFAGGRRMR